MKLLLGALATLLLLPHGAVSPESSPIIGEDSGCCEDWDRQHFTDLQVFQDSTCYGHTCPHGLASIMDVSPCDCRQVDPGSKDVECCYQPCSAGAVSCPSGAVLIDSWPCLNGVCSSDVCCAVGCNEK